MREPKRLYLITLIIFLQTFSFAQSANELFEKKDYKKLTKLADKEDQLTAEDLYKVGYAFYILENDTKAIEFYDKAMKKGLNNDLVHFYKGLSLNYMDKYDEALKEIEIALSISPDNSEFLNEKGLVLFKQLKYDKAIEFFEAAIRANDVFPDCYYWIAKTYHAKKDYKTALLKYQEALKYIPKENGYYSISIKNIGQIAYLENRDYTMAAKFYNEAIELDKEDYDLYYCLIRAFNRGHEYAKADSVFLIVKRAFEKGKLPKNEMEVKSIIIDEFEWNKRDLVIRKSFVDPKETLDISYKVFLYDESGEKVERRFVVEKTIQFEEDGANHLLCEQVKKDGSHKTYPYGWSTDNIPVADLQRLVIAILNNEIKEGASSNFGGK